jgi:type I restriction enzyme R subunit
MPNEAHARLLINDQLQKSGWTLVDSASRKADVHVEYPTSKENLDSGHAKHGFADYLLFDQHSFPLAVIEAKAEHIHPLAAKEQARAYARSQHIRFVYLSNGKVTFFWDLHDGNPVPRTGFHSPAELAALAASPAAGQSTGARTRQAIDPGQGRRLLPESPVAADYLARSQIPDYDQLGQWKNESSRPAFIAQHKLCFLRPYQLAAIQAVQAAVAAGKNRYLLEMATGTGKTKTCAALIKLFLKSGATHRVLFLVDRVELEDQAEKAFNQVLAKDYATLVYKRQRRDWRKAEIVVSTVQSFMANERYREEFSPADFGLIISDEAHRSINGEARKVFEYFRGYKLGLTATPRDFLRGVWAEGKKLPDEFELDRRSFLDTYIIFGCDSGLPTFRYSLLDGVRDGYLVNPTVLDCRTEKTTKLLSEEGLSFTVTDDEGNEEEANFGKRDFEKRYFSNETNRAFVQTFLDHALRDPVSGEIGIRWSSA